MNNCISSPPIPPQFSWNEVDTVLLDMDGTLLDKYFDDFFWEEYVPAMFAEKNNLEPAEARKQLLAKYQSVENTLQWTDLDYWSDQLGLEIPELKYKVDHLIKVHPYVLDFLQFIRDLDKKLYLVTNAHCKALDLKLKRTPIGPYFHRIINSQEVGIAKEHPAFWEKLQTILHFDKATTLLADDTPKVLSSAKEWGLHHLIFVARPSSRRPIKHSNKFPSITYFNELIF